MPRIVALTSISGIIGSASSNAMANGASTANAGVQHRHPWSFDHLSSCASKQATSLAHSQLQASIARVQGKLDPVVGRVKEIERVIQILGRRTKNNPCLVGEPGVGKTAVAEGLAQKIANNDVPETIEGKQVVTLDMGLLVAGTKYRGEFEERLKKLMDEIKQNDDIILVRTVSRVFIKEE